MANLVRIDTPDGEVWYVNKDQIQYIYPCATNNRRTIIVMATRTITVEKDTETVYKNLFEKN